MPEHTLALAAPRAADPSPTVAPLPTAPAANEPQLEVAWARHADELRSAQALRWRVFVDELGARLNPPPGTPPGLDADRFDAHCEHLLVRTREDAHGPARVVGTYRLLTPSAAQRLGGLYTDTEFDLHRLDPLRPRLAELGRSCTDPAFRHGGVILMLWATLVRFMQDNGIHAAIGCASVPMRDGGHAAASLWRQLQADHLAPATLRVQPRLALPLAHLQADLRVEPPPLVKGYLRCGAQLLGAPAWDPDFGVADLPMLLQLSALAPAYRRRFLRA